MHSAMHQFSLGMAAKDTRLQGVVRINVSVTIANFIQPELLGVLHSLQPGIYFDVVATDSPSNLHKREADIAIRLMQPVHSELIAKRVAWFNLGLYASHAYVARCDVPQPEPQQLLRHRFIDVAPQHLLRERFAKTGLPQLAERIVCVASDHASAWQMVRAGLGIGSSLKVVARLDGLVGKVLTDVRPGRFPVWLVTHKELRQQPRLRVVAD